MLSFALRLIDSLWNSFFPHSLILLILIQWQGLFSNSLRSTASAMR